MKDSMLKLDLTKKLDSYLGETNIIAVLGWIKWGLLNQIKASLQHLEMEPLLNLLLCNTKHFDLWKCFMNKVYLKILQ